MRTARTMHEPRGWVWWLAVAIVKPLLLLLTKPRWVDGNLLPTTGGAVVAANHVSHVDPLTFAHLVHDHGRIPRFLAKAVLFEVFFVGWVLRATGQIPVKRQTTDATRAFSAAVDAVGRGQLVVVYPEGTITRQPQLWPMTGKTGAAHIALVSGVPVVPVAQWGAHELLPPYSLKPRLLPRTTVHAKVGAPVDLEDLRGREITPEVLRDGTERIMDAITALLEDIRGETAPPERFDPRRAGVRLTGNPDPHPRRGHSRKRNR